MSPIVDVEETATSEPDGGYESNQGAAADTDDEGEDEDDSASQDAPSASDVAPKPVLDASTAKDAAIATRDAGQGSATPQDAGPPSSGTIPPATDAGRPITTRPPANAAMCRAASDCKQSCVPIGIFSCCRDNGTCGCTWAPGAYCL